MDLDTNIQPQKHFVKQTQEENFLHHITNRELAPALQYNQPHKGSLPDTQLRFLGRTTHNTQRLKYKTRHPSSVTN